jgi:nucleotide-binding universal stress UspA family protein
MNKQKKEFKRIVLAVDDSDSSRRAARKAIYIAKETGIEITALHVIYIPIVATPPPPAYMPNKRKTMEKNGKKLLDEIEKRGLDNGIKIKKKLLEGVPDNEIIKFARKNDIIIMGSKGHSALDRILIGSTSENVLHHSNSTVMIVR